MCSGRLGRDAGDGGRTQAGDAGDGLRLRPGELGRDATAGELGRDATAGELRPGDNRPPHPTIVTIGRATRARLRPGDGGRQSPAPPYNPHRRNKTTGSCLPVVRILRVVRVVL